MRRCLTAHSIYPSSGTKSSTSNGSTSTGMLSPRGGTPLCSATLSAVIRSSVTRAGGGAQLTAALYLLIIPQQYHPWRRCQASWMRGGSAPTSASTSAPASSALRFRSATKLALTALPSCLFIACPFRGSRRAETLLLTSLHVSSDIHEFRLAARGCAFGTPLHRALKSFSTRVGFVGGLTGHRFLPPKYRLCSVREALGRQPRTM